ARDFETQDAAIAVAAQRVGSARLDGAQRVNEASRRFLDGVDSAFVHRPRIADHIEGLVRPEVRSEAAEVVRVLIGALEAEEGNARAVRLKRNQRGSCSFAAGALRSVHASGETGDGGADEEPSFLNHEPV